MTLRIATVVFAALLASGCDTSPVRQNEASMVQYGPKPNYWQDSVRSYLKLRLVDPTAAIIEFRTSRSSSTSARSAGATRSTAGRCAYG
jgi:hypothetical protein